MPKGQDKNKHLSRLNPTPSCRALPATRAKKNLLHIATLLGAHGLKGWVKLKSRTEQALDIEAYSPLQAKDGRLFTLLDVRTAGGGMIKAKIDGITTPEQAEQLHQVKLFVTEDTLPELEDDNVYYKDLPGLAVQLADGTPLGVVDHPFDSGAHTVLAIEKNGGIVAYIPYIDSIVDHIDTTKKTLVVTQEAQSFFDL